MEGVEDRNRLTKLRIKAELTCTQQKSLVLMWPACRTSARLFPDEPSKHCPFDACLFIPDCFEKRTIGNLFRIDLTVPAPPLVYLLSHISSFVIYTNNN
jgi:hypothetical protein